MRRFMLVVPMMFGSAVCGAQDCVAQNYGRNCVAPPACGCQGEADRGFEQPVERGSYVRAPESGDFAGEVTTYGVRGFGLRLPAISIDLPELRLPSLVKYRRGPEMLVEQSRAPYHPEPAVEVNQVPYEEEAPRDFSAPDRDRGYAPPCYPPSCVPPANCAPPVHAVPPAPAAQMTRAEDLGWMTPREAYLADRLREQQQRAEQLESKLTSLSAQVEAFMARNEQASQQGADLTETQAHGRPPLREAQQTSLGYREQQVRQTEYLFEQNEPGQAGAEQARRGAPLRASDVPSEPSQPVVRGQQPVREVPEQRTGFGTRLKSLFR